MSISIPVVIWTIICFFLLYFLLRTFLYKPLVKFMDDRKARIDAGLEEGRKARQAKEENQLQLADELRKTGGDAKKILAEAKEADEQQRQKALDNAHSQAADVMKDAKGRVEAERERAAGELDGRMSELVSALAGRLLEDNDCVAVNSQLIKSCVDAAEKQ